MDVRTWDGRGPRAVGRWRGDGGEMHGGGIAGGVMARLVDDLDQGARRAEAGERERHDAILLDVVLGRGVGTPLPQTRRRAWSVHAWSVHGQCMVSAWSVHG